MKNSFSLLVVFCLLLMPSTVSADDTPQYQIPGAGILPDNINTTVEMVSEYIYFGVNPTAPKGSPGQAVLDAFYFTKNLSPADVYMTVRTPLTLLPKDIISTATPAAAGVTVSVNKSPVAVRQVVRSEAGQPDTPYAEFNVLFPNRQTTTIEVKYNILGTVVYPYVSYKYLLEGASDWYGKITTAFVSVNLPYQADDQNTFQAENGSGLSTTPFGVFHEKSLSWTYKEMIMDKDSFVEVSLVVPDVWQNVLKERTNVAQLPSDGQAWSRLADLYASLILMPQGIRTDSGGQDLFRMDLEAYQKAISLLPGNTDVVVAYADLLYNHYYRTRAAGIQPDQSEIVLALQELEHVLAVSPRNEKATSLLQTIQNTIPGAIEVQAGSYNFLWLTATPTINASLFTLTPTSSPTETPITTPTGEIETSTPPALPAANNNQSVPPLCGGAALLPIFIASFVRLRRGRRTFHV